MEVNIPYIWSMWAWEDWGEQVILKVVEAVKWMKFDQNCWLLNSALCFFVLYDCASIACDRWRLLVAVCVCCCMDTVTRWQWFDHAVFLGQRVCLFTQSSPCFCWLVIPDIYWVFCCRKKFYFRNFWVRIWWLSFPSQCRARKSQKRRRRAVCVILGGVHASDVDSFQVNF